MRTSHHPTEDPASTNPLVVGRQGQGQASRGKNALAIELHELSKSYGKSTVLHQVSFEVAASERVCIVGANGCGKTTLLEILSGAKHASSGSATLFGCDPQAQATRRRRGVQLEKAFFPYYARVQEVVDLYRHFVPGAISRDELLETFELKGTLAIRHLSKGQRQRLSIALALLGRPEIILLDEPTSGLDPKSRDHIWSLLERQLSAHKAALLFATHDLDEAERWADRVAIMQGGELKIIEAPETLKRELIGTRRKVTVVGEKLEEIPALSASPPVRSTARLGRETAFYCDDPEAWLASGVFRGLDRQIRIENVSLRDVFFRVTGEVAGV